MQRVALGEVVVGRPLALEDGDCPRLGQRYQRVEPGGGAPGRVGDDYRVFRLAYQLRHALNRRRVGVAHRGGRTVLERRSRRPLLQHRLDGDVQKGRAHGRPLGQLAGAGHRFVQRRRAGHPAAPLGERLHQAVGAADDAQVSQPLRAGVHLRHLAVGGRLAGTDQHRHLALVGAVNAHRPLHHPDAGVEQDGLHPAGHAGVAGGHRHRQRLMPAVDVGRPRLLVHLLPGQSLPHRRPLGTGRGDDVVYVQVSQRFEDGVAAVQPRAFGHCHTHRVLYSPSPLRERVGVRVKF